MHLNMTRSVIVLVLGVLRYKHRKIKKTVNVLNHKIVPHGNTILPLYFSVLV